jgi:hypothetical protein
VAAKRTLRKKIYFAEHELEQLKKDAMAEGRTVADLIRSRSLRPIPCLAKAA